MTPSKQATLLQGLPNVARKVFEQVPIQDAWEPIQIQTTLRAQARSNIDMHVLRGCLRTLKEAGLIKETSHGRFRRVDTRTPAANQKDKEPPMAKATSTSVSQHPAPAPAPADQDIELFATLASEMNSLADEFSSSLKKLAGRLEEAALAAEQHRERLAADVEAVRKFKAALAALP